MVGGGRRGVLFEGLGCRRRRLDLRLMGWGGERGGGWVG